MEDCKETELGLLPEDWEVVKVDDLFYVKQETSPES